MRRRRIGEQIPRHLLIFDAMDWVGVPVWVGQCFDVASHEAWAAARAAWATVHGWPGGEAARLADEARVLAQLGVEGQSR